MGKVTTEALPHLGELRGLVRALGILHGPVKRAEGPAPLLGLLGIAVALEVAHDCKGSCRRTT